jgi:hypothetical protein
LAKYADSLMPDPTPGITGTVTALATNANPEDFEKMLRLAEATKQTITKGGPPSLLAQAARLTRQLAKSLLPF